MTIVVNGIIKVKEGMNNRGYVGRGENVGDIYVHRGVNELDAGAVLRVYIDDI